MYTKKLISIGFIAMIVLSMATVSMADPWDSVVDDPTPAQAIWVDPSSSGPFNMSDEFIVDVLVNITDPDGAGPNTGMFGFEYKLKWNSTLVEVQSIQIHSPWAIPPAFIVANTTGVWGDGRLYHQFAITALPPEVPFTGVTSLCTYKFKVKYQPSFPDPDLVGTLDIQEDKLVAGPASADLIPHTTSDGIYTLLSVQPPIPEIRIVPAYVVGVYGVNFTVDIEIVQLAAALDLWGWEAKLSYNTSVLDCLASAEGPFLPGFAGANGTMSVNIINDTLGIVHMAGFFMGAHSKPFGTGVVETLTFNATYEFEVPTEGAPPFVFPMDLYATKLSIGPCQPLDHNVTDGMYEAPYRTLGWSLDCWTDPYRKKCETPFTGIGPGMNADAYEPQELVTLYAYLAYNEYEVQDKIISFSIYGPRNPYYNITIYRTAQTNASGVATINFTIPHPCEYVEEVVFGKWMCFQKAQVKFGEPNDTIWWTVGWIVELLDAEVDDEVRPCESLNITIFYKNIMMISKFVLFTFTIYDELLDPIGDIVIGVQVPAGAWCHPYFGNATTSIHIPKWVHVGPGGTLYVNAFTALPVDCGCPYCPEISVTVNIVKP